MKIYESEQGTEQWLLDRSAHFSASPALDLFAAPSTAKYQNLINNVVFEKLTGKIIPTYINDAMRTGTEREPIAREKFSLDNFIKVVEVGFIESSEFVGMSSDGLIGEDGLIEIKCPSHTMQISYLINRKVPKQYLYQMQFQMMVSGRCYCYFYSYHPDLPAFQVKVTRDDIIITDIRLELDKAIKLVKERLNKLERK